VPASPELWQGTVERLGWGGHGLARAADGRLILLRAPLALVPGEAVEARVVWKARHGEGDVTRWLTADPRRVPPACSVARECGGCSLWGVDAELRGELKREMAADLLRRMLPGAPEWDWLPAPPQARRSRIQLHWDGARLGYHARGTNDLVPVDACPLAADAVSRAIPALADLLAGGGLPGAPARWELATGTPPTQVAASAHGRTWWIGADSAGAADPRVGPRQPVRPDGGEPPREDDSARLQHRLGEARLQQHPRAFFQAAPAWAWEAFGRVFDAWDLRGARLYDLYGGGGFFSVLLAPRFGRCEVVESSPLAVADAHLNLGQAAMRDAIFLQADVGDGLPFQPPDWAGPGETILLDPPRAGLPEAVSAWLSRCQAGNIVLVGCDGAAFCRDVKRILAGAQWRLARLAVVDLFPNTPEVECVGLLER
jgi:23S rRNA (uracil1939-C5)-methyltransferase